MKTQIRINIGIEVEPETISGACVLYVLERRIRRMSGAAIDTVESEAKVTADSHWSNLQHLTFDFCEALFDGRCLQFSRNGC